jgi:DNA-binding MarR family transcriptional regulator
MITSIDRANPASPLPDLPCACATARRAARLVTQLYSAHLRSYGLEAAQVSLLAILKNRPGRSQTQLAKALGYDKTTLSRNLKLIEQNGWVKAEAIAGQRENGLYLTREGRKLVKQTAPGWDRAQEQLRSAMTRAEWKAMWKGMRALTRAAQEIGSPK